MIIRTGPVQETVKHLPHQPLPRPTDAEEERRRDEDELAWRWVENKLARLRWLEGRE